MKKLFIICSLITLALFTQAQNIAINNDGTTAHTSAMLDVKSITKGFLMPRMTSAQRSAIASPIIGLLVFDTDTKTMWAYDGNGWKNLYTSGGLALPYSQNVNLATPGFLVSNQGLGAGVEGTSSNEFGMALSGKTTGAFGWGLFAYSNRPGAKTINAITDSGTVFHGENNYVSNTNTLMNLLNRGLAKTLSVQLANTNSTSPNMQIAGNNLAEQLMIYQTNVANTKAAVQVNNSGTGFGIHAMAASGTGIRGESAGAGSNGVYGLNTSTGVGVRGESINGTGMVAYSTNGTGISASSIAGTGMNVYSISGLALNVNGNLKIAGGNTTPGAGKILTSDANGNATWQAPAPPPVTPKIAFRATNVVNDLLTNLIPAATFERVHFDTEQYDLSNSYDVHNGTETDKTSTFTAPIGGIYHFDAAVNFLFATTFDYRELEIELRVYRNGATSTLAKGGSFINDVDNTYTHLSTDVRLYANDIVWIAIRQWNTISEPSFLVNTGAENYFNGHLVIEL